ncbi:MAG: HIT family protein [Bacteroidota bacterium]
MSCIFCKIIQGVSPAETLYQNKHAVAILDINPIHYGHALIIPRTHCETFTDLPEGDYLSVMNAMQIVSKAILETFKPAGFNIFSNNGKAAGQSVFHFHFHITPRYDNDNIKFLLSLKKYKDGELFSIAESVRGNIQKISLNESLTT